jgi:predicted nucleic acid-binding protein
MKKYLVDTNLLLRSAQPLHPMHQAAVATLRRLKRDKGVLCIAPQNLIEFWAVATRPVENNGLGRSVAQAAQELAELKKLFTLLPDSPAIFPEWEKLVVSCEVKGKPTHDARIVAIMKANGIDHLVTFNSSDFKRFSVTIIEPGEDEPKIKETPKPAMS